MKKAKAHRWLVLALLIAPCVGFVTCPHPVSAQVIVTDDTPGGGTLGDPDIPSTKPKSPGLVVSPRGPIADGRRFVDPMNSRSEVAVIADSRVVIGRLWLRGIGWLFKSRFGW